MKLFESFRSAADKYGDTLAREMLTAGIPDKYILAACRFHQESNGKESDILAVQFRQWMSFVVPKDKTIDVNKLSYTEFTQIIDSARKFIYAPNCLYNDGTWSIGIWNSFQEAKLYPIENRWCICHSYKKWKEYVDIKGSVFYIVNCNDTNINQDYRHVCVEIEPNGEIYFWFTDNQSTHIDFLPNYFNCLPESIKEIITTESNTRGNKHYNITDTENNKTDKNESKNMNRKNTIRLTESELKQIITESAKNVLKEYNSNVREPNEDERKLTDAHHLLWQAIDLLEKVDFDNIMDYHGDSPREVRLNQSLAESEVYRMKNDVRTIKRIVSSWGKYLNSILPLFRKSNGDGTSSWIE